MLGDVRQCNAMQSTAMQWNAMKSVALQHCAMRYPANQCDGMVWNGMRYNGMPYAMQCNADHRCPSFEHCLASASNSHSDSDLESAVNHRRFASELSFAVGFKFVVGFELGFCSGSPATHLRKSNRFLKRIHFQIQCYIYVYICVYQD